MTTNPVLIAGQWRAAQSTESFRAENPATGQALPGEFPISAWKDCDDALDASVEAAGVLRSMPAENIARCLTRFAERIEARKNELVEMAHIETALPKSPRLAEVELPRTTNQLRQAAAAALDGSWASPIIDVKLNIRSLLVPIGPVLIFGPNNFPFAYNGVSGGDFAAALAAGNPVIAKAHPNHPATTRLLAEEVFEAVKETNLPAAAVQMIYNIAPQDGLKLAADPRLGAIGFTGSRAAGLKLKSAADAVGKPAYFELSSLNPVLIFPGALAERGAKIVEEFTGSCLMASGQFCTSPGLLVLFEGEAAEQFVAAVKSKFENALPSTLLSSGVARNLDSGVKTLLSAGARLVTGGLPLPGNRFANTFLRVSGQQFLTQPHQLQTEAFGNASLAVVVRDESEAVKVIGQLEGNLTGSIYSDSQGADELLYAKLAPLLRMRVGRFLNDKMPTGVAVTAAMNHGGPFPATGHPVFTAVGMPGAMRRFVMLQCFDNVRPERLPDALRNRNPNGKMWRLVDGQLTRENVHE